jgi:hypothetical protein
MRAISWPDADRMTSVTPDSTALGSSVSVIVAMPPAPALRLKVSDASPFTSTCPRTGWVSLSGEADAALLLGSLSPEAAARVSVAAAVLVAPVAGSTTDAVFQRCRRRTATAARPRLPSMLVTGHGACRAPKTQTTHSPSSDPVPPRLARSRIGQRRVKPCPRDIERDRLMLAGRRSRHRPSRPLAANR